jgi:hypothetical protein
VSTHIGVGNQERMEREVEVLRRKRTYREIIGRIRKGENVYLDPVVWADPLFQAFMVGGLKANEQLLRDSEELAVIKRVFGCRCP